MQFSFVATKQNRIALMRRKSTKSSSSSSSGFLLPGKRQVILAIATLLLGASAADFQQALQATNSTIAKPPSKGMFPLDCNANWPNEIIATHGDLVGTCGVSCPPSIVAMSAVNANSSVNNRIINAAIALPGQFPYMAAIYFRDAQNQDLLGCGGSIIDEFHILTAAHCVFIKNTTIPQFELNFVVVGSHERAIAMNRAPVQKIKISSVFYHSEYIPLVSSNEDRNDIAILRLGEPIKFVITRSGYGSVASVCLSDHQRLPSGGLIVSGWGGVNNDFANPVPSTVLKTQVVSNYKKASKLELLLLGLTRKGDSGGPYVYQVLAADGSDVFVQAAIVSRGNEEVSFATFVPAYYEWIRGVLIGQCKDCAWFDLPSAFE